MSMGEGARLAFPVGQRPKAHLSEAIGTRVPLTTSRTVSVAALVFRSAVWYGRKASGLRRNVKAPVTGISRSENSTRILPTIGAPLGWTATGSVVPILFGDGVRSPSQPA